ncbi:MAG TPA: MJ0042-type zinc finger domain-containing protein, partial [Steroidobacteraceae bacterium]|nr:MJ0042-type zinc finger domain-containing protein [Steroidobacteraceae bacterium]
MYSQCPECLTRFRVTAAALRAAQGTVRCGRCGSAFDALQRLTDTVPDEAESPPSSSSSSSRRASTLAGFDTPGLTGGRSAESAGDAEAVTEFHFSA